VALTVAANAVRVTSFSSAHRCPLVATRLARACFELGVRHLRQETGAVGVSIGIRVTVRAPSEHCSDRIHAAWVSYELRKSPIKFAGGSRIEVERTCSVWPMGRGAAVVLRALSASRATGSVAQSAEPIAALTSLSSRCNTELGVGTRPAGSVNRQVTQTRV
jgi:hypothetical protein